MSELTVLELLGQAREPAKMAAQPSAAPAAQEEMVVEVEAPAPAQTPSPVAPASPLPIPPPHLRVLERRAKQAPQDTQRWQHLLHNAWQLHGSDDPQDVRLFQALLACCLSGAQLVRHKEAGLAIRFSPEQIEALCSTGDSGLFRDEAEYRELATEFLAPERERLTRLLSLTALGVVDDEDLSWVYTLKPAEGKAETARQRRAG
jgi:hypothetical protein